MSDERNGCDFDPDALEVVVRKEVPGQLEALTPAVEEVMAVARGMECSQGKEFEIETALREALANAIRHGCRNDPDKRVEVCVACDPARGILIVVRDPGAGFDPTSIPSPVRGRNLYRHHGRGIYLINQLMDEVSFERGGTEIRMLKR
ncbi:MAG: ATP-binding protein [Burkholderiales bacterium]|jgi:serine/threonine-protein kinase RsbW